MNHHQTSETLPHQSSIFIQRFYLQTHKSPNKIAIIAPEQSITYHALANRAANIARSLQQKGITRETPVAILLPPGIEQIICQVAILMAKGSCVPLDTNMPEARLNDMLDDIQAHWTITSSLENHKNLHTTILNFHDLLSENQSIENDLSDIPSTHRTHILFTSGTTGKPKAVEIEAKGILRLVVDTHYINFTSDDRIACIANPTFDASLFEVWGALLNGATIVIIPKQDILNIEHFRKKLIQQKITIMFMTASLFNLIASTAPRTFRFFRYLLVGGEALNPHTLKLVLEAGPPEHLLNGYGPTESTTFALTHDIKLSDLNSGSVPIGRPIDRTQAFILDENLSPLTQGETGHLYLGGDGLARGYWNRDELNKDRFVSVSMPGYPSPLRLYKTGDLSMQRKDGVFMYGGRLDNQIKIRGHRIELEDIECQLLKSDQVKSAAVVLVKSGSISPFLAAFVVPWEPLSFKTQALDKALSQCLPEYMLPRLFITDEIPLTPTGKTDRNQLLAQLNDRKVDDERPESFNDTEYRVLRIWRNILNINHIALDDSFFQLGGSSLHAASLIIELGREFAHNYSLQTLYDAPTLRELAKAISYKSTSHSPDDDVTQWLQDAQLPDDIQPLPGTPQDWAELSGATALLTGVTGFLGAFFLRDLLAQPHIKKVICLVRAADKAIARQRIEHNLSQYGLWPPANIEGLSVITGDISLPNLGLSEALYNQLTMDVNVIFHLGAHVNYIQPYQAHRAGNIDGTLNILRLATHGIPKALHYSSTIAAFGPAGLLNNVERIYESDDLKPYLEGMKYDSGYSQSQWVVEQFIWEAKERGVPLSVYRPGFIVGDSVHGQGNPKDFVARLIRGCIAIGAYPILPRQKKEFIPVDYVSAALLTIAQDHKNLGQAYHLVPPGPAQSIDLDQFFELLGESGYPLQKLPYAEWVATLDKDPNLYDNPLMPLVPMLAETVYQNKTRWEVYENMPVYDTSNTQAALTKAQFPLTFTPMDKHLLSLHLSFWKKSGLLPALPTKALS